MLLGAVAASDLLGPNIYGMGSVDAYLPNARFDNSVAWQHKFSSVSLGATYSFGRDTAGGVPASGTCGGEQNQVSDAQACRGWSAMLRYDGGAFGLAAAIDEQKGGNGATAFFFNGAAPIAFTSSGDKDRRINAGGYFKFAKGKVGLGWLGREVETAAVDVSSDIVYLTASYELSQLFTIDGGINRITNDDQDRDATLVVLRGFYNIDKGLSAYVQVGHIANSSTATYALSGAGGGTAPSAGESQNGYMVGMRYMF
jgi:predicted porin